MLKVVALIKAIEAILLILSPIYGKVIDLAMELVDTWGKILDAIESPAELEAKQREARGSIENQLMDEFSSSPTSLSNFAAVIIAHLCGWLRKLKTEKGAASEAAKLERGVQSNKLGKDPFHVFGVDITSIPK